MATIKDLIRKTLRLHLSEECVRLTRISMGFTRKKVTPIGNKPGLHAKRTAFEKKRVNILPGQVIPIDESSFWFDMKPGYGYSKRRRLERSDSYKKVFDGHCCLPCQMKGCLAGSCTISRPQRLLLQHSRQLSN